MPFLLSSEIVSRVARPGLHNLLPEDVGAKSTERGERRGQPVWREGGVGQVAGVVVGSRGGRSGGVQAQGQRGHAEGILGGGVGPEATEVLLWDGPGRHSVRQLSGQAGGRRTKGGSHDLVFRK